MSKILTIDFKLCTGCRICEMACSLRNKKECNPNRANIRVICSEEQGYPVTIPVACMNCTIPLCEKVCPTGATYRDNATSAMRVDEDICIGCSACVYACPFGASFIDSETLKASRCDLCGGDPLCARMCPTGALKYAPRDEATMRLRRTAFEVLGRLDKEEIIGTVAKE